MRYYAENPDEPINHDWFAGAQRIEGPEPEELQPEPCILPPKLPEAGEMEINMSEATPETETVAVIIAAATAAAIGRAHEAEVLELLEKLAHGRKYQTELNDVNIAIRQEVEELRKCYEPQARDCRGLFDLKPGESLLFAIETLQQRLTTAEGRLEEIGDAATWLICDPAISQLGEASQNFLQSIRKDGANIFNDLRTKLTTAEAAHKKAVEFIRGYFMDGVLRFPDGRSYREHAKEILAALSPTPTAEEKTDKPLDESSA